MMKRLSIVLLSLLAVTMFTACGNDDEPVNNNDDEPVNKQTVTMALNARWIDTNYGYSNTIVFSQNTGKVELNYTDMTIKLSASYKGQNGATQLLETPEMKMKQLKGTVYDVEIVDGAVTYFPLVIDLGTGMLWYDNPVSSSNGPRLFITSQLLYAYTTTAMRNEVNGNYGSHEQSAYVFALDDKGETCSLYISNFMSTLNGAVDAPEVRYSGLTVTPTLEGYKISAGEVESNYKGFYTLTDVEFNVYSQCLSINGSFKCNGLKYNVSGSLFPSGTY